MALAFFGLQPKNKLDQFGNELLSSDNEPILDYSDIIKYRSLVHEEILSLIYFSQGGFDWKQLYSEIPIQMRKFYIGKLSEILKKQNENQTESTPVPKAPVRPSFRPKVPTK